MSKSSVRDVDKGWKSILRAAGDVAKGATVRVGVLGDDTRGGLHRKNPDGSAASLTVLETAIVNEYGTEDGHIPARPAHRNAYDKNREKLQRAAFGLLTRVVLDRDLSVENALNLLGLKHATNIKNEITQGDGVPPPNAPSTIEAKGSSRPLVDTGVTVNSISWSVTIGTDEKPHKYLTGGK